MKKRKTITDRSLANALNEWLKQYEADPEAFENEYAMIKEFLWARENSEASTYGPQSVEYMRRKCGL